MTNLTKQFILSGAIAGWLCAQSAPPNNYLVHNLVSDLPGIADHQDKNLVNPWGNGFGPTPFWIGNNNTGTSTLYDGTGTAIPLVVKIPQAGGAGTAGPVTGVIFNAFSANTSAFQVGAGKSSLFIFCSEEGVVSGWNQTVDLNNAKVLLDNSKAGAVYKGCALGGTAAAPLLFAANFAAGTVDIVDGGLNLNPVAYGRSFSNPAIPAGFAPFNVQNINGTIFVTYAKQDGKKHDDVAGAGNGYVAMFDQTGNLIKNLINQSSLNSPWGMAMAPSVFGAFAGDLLVANFGDGTINAFDPVSGKQLGTLNDLNGKPITIPGLWSLNFGSGAQSEDTGTLYFTAGIGDGPNNASNLESHGLLGSIQGPPVFTTAGILNGASGLPSLLVPNTWMALKGNAMSTTTGNWVVTGSTLPTLVNGVNVKLNGVAVPVSFVSNGQINFLVPFGTPATNAAQLQVVNNGLTSATVTIGTDSLSPGFFPLGTQNGKQYAAATHADGSLIGPPNLIKGVTTTPAKPGETIVLYGTGFGGTTPQSTLLVNHTIVIDGLVADVAFAGLVGPGLYQFNVTVPPTVDTGVDAFVIALASNSETQAGIFIPIQGNPIAP